MRTESLETDNKIHQAVKWKRQYANKSQLESYSEFHSLRGGTFLRATKIS